jgi:phenylalanyl-tRNA synthetase beta chain
MRVPMRWLREYVDPEASTDEIARLLTASGTEVGYVAHVGQHWDRVVIGRVLEVRKHENADNLNVVRVDVGDEEITLVTAAPNVQEGFVVPIVRDKGKLAADQVLEARRFRGILSEGMLCSGDELGVSADKDHIYELEPEAPVGVDLRDYLADDVLDIELTPNRADCLGIVGIAREVAALTGAQLQMPPAEPWTGAQHVADLVKVFVDDPDLCPRYTAAYLADVRLGPSPLWMQRRLHLAGVRAISNVVDVTNYVMLELGQPLHAFDADLLHEMTIHVRRARPDERITTIDEVERALTPEMLVIADADRPVALAGIMGGNNSEISDHTTRIVLESATFDALNIRRTSRALRLGTEASKRFDKGLDPELPPLAARRAIRLMMELAGGSPAEGIVDMRAASEGPRRIAFDRQDVVGLIGQDYRNEQIEDVLRPLGFEVQRSGDHYDVAAPSWRGDVEGKADISEEVARIVGYDAIPTVLPSGQIPPAWEDPVLRHEEEARTALAGAGIQEVKTYSFVGPYALSKIDAQAAWPAEEPDAALIPLYNPMSIEQSRLRTTLLPSLLQTAAENLRFQRRVPIFEIARVYLPPLEPLPNEVRRLGIVLAGRRSPDGWGNGSAPFDFYDLKAAIEAAFGAVRAPAPTYEPRGAAWSHPGRSAAILAASGGEPIGYAGQVHPQVAARFDIEGVDVYAAELDFAAIAALAREEVEVQPLPRFPAADRDLALLLNEDVPHEQVAATIRRAGGQLLERVTLFDVYRGEPVPPGQRSLAYALTFRSPERTLTEDEVGRAMNAIERAVTRTLGAQVRGR